ncbi:MAG: hypothetical protein D6800_06780 [Candidatus Zixiibacteriota bacterium]|nr:MAG: hypothetical protein D6800_06780 [candidate division Zixibacteria bacterium]
MSKISNIREFARGLRPHTADESAIPGRHRQDEVLEQLLIDALVGNRRQTRALRTSSRDVRSLWDPRANEYLAEKINQLSAGDELDPVERKMAEVGLIEVVDQYTAERVRNMKSEILSRFVTGLIPPQTNLINNLFTTVQADAGETLGQLQELVTIVETYSDFEYYRIDPNRGDIRSVEVNFSQYADRINPQMAMYGVKIEYENFLHRVLNNTSIADLLSMVVIGWAKASATAREYDAAKFLTNYLAPGVAFDNNDSGKSRWGQLSGVGINGIQNGTFDVDRDLPRLMDYMQNELGMSSNIVMVLPKNAWAFMNMRKGYRRFLGLDGQPLYQRPDFQRGPLPAAYSEERYGIRIKGVGFPTPAAAAKYLSGTREGQAGLASSVMPPGPFPFLPESVPNWLDTFSLPNAAFPGMRVVLTPHVQAQHRFYAQGHPLRNDEMTGKPRAIMTTDILFFDASRPMWLIESIPPTAWDATNEEYRKSVLTMVEAYAMANSARGQQACVIRGAVLDDNYTHEIRLNASDIKITDQPLSGGSGNPGGLVQS